MKPRVVLLACHSAVRTHYSIKLVDRKHVEVWALSEGALFDLRDRMLGREMEGVTAAELWAMWLGEWALQNWRYVEGCWCRIVRQNRVDEANREPTANQVAEIGVSLLAELVDAEVMVPTSSRRHKVARVRLRKRALNAWVEAMVIALFGIKP